MVNDVFDLLGRIGLVDPHGDHPECPGGPVQGVPFRPGIRKDAELVPFVDAETEQLQGHVLHLGCSLVPGHLDPAALFLAAVAFLVPVLLYPGHEHFV